MYMQRQDNKKKKPFWRVFSWRNCGINDKDTETKICLSLKRQPVNKVANLIFLLMSHITLTFLQSFTFFIHFF